MPQSQTTPRPDRASRLLLPLAALACAVLTSCGGGGGGGSSSSAGSSGPRALTVVGLNVAPGQDWPLNRAFEIQFDRDVDFSTVSANTLRVFEASDPARIALGDLELSAPRTVRLQPACPQSSDLTDGGLAAGVEYVLEIPGQDQGGPTIRSTGGGRIETTVTVAFQTPTSSDPGELYDDVAGPPRAVLRSAGSMQAAATYVEIGRDDAARVYYERDAAGTPAFPPGFTVPLNLYSDPGERVAWIVQLDQALLPGAENLARVQLEYESGPGAWSALGADVELEVNCGPDGARLRLTPRGLLPQGLAVRARLAAGLSDLVGQTLTTDVPVAPAPAAVAFDPGTTTPGDGADAVLERFALSAGAPDSLEDDVTPLALPRARWGPGGLAASWNFAGTGGPGGDFDWHVPPGTVFVLDTTLTTILGGPGGAPARSQDVVGGVLQVRDLLVPAGATIEVVGPNPLTVYATGAVTIAGEIDLDGGDSPGVTVLRAADLPEPGGAGRGGGGDGGVGSPATSLSSTRGGAGNGPFHAPEGGGAGGQSSLASADKNARRGAGGGGGRLGPDVLYRFQGSDVRCQTLIGMDVEPGFGGGALGVEPLAGLARAAGGAPGPGPFVDADPANDFFGTLLAAGGERIRGELDAPLPGAGGGAGGDAIEGDFPLGTFDRTGDEKAAGGGGGAGALHVLALGPILVGPLGSVHADGGRGASGESTSFRDSVGGGSGGGSGGTLVLESLTSIEVQASAAGAGALYADDPAQDVHPRRPLRALGGQGGAGNQGKGGAVRGQGTQWRCDAIPAAHFDGSQAPPALDLCAQAHLDRGDPLGPSLGAGGDGGPGLIQLHVPDPGTDLTFPPHVAGDLTRVCAPPPVGWDGTQLAGGLLPGFGPRSMAQSRWIALGLAVHDPAGLNEPLRFFLGGVGGDGRVPTQAGSVALEAPLLGPLFVLPPPGTPRIEGGGSVMVFDATPLVGTDDDVFLRNPALATGGTIRLTPLGGGAGGMDFDVVAATYDAATRELDLSVDDAAGSLSDYQPGGVVEAAWIPRAFRVTSGGVPDALSDDHSVRFRFDAAPADGAGEPDASATYSMTQGAWANTIEELTGVADWRFLRFRVEFDLDRSMSGFDPSEPTPTLELLTVPFRF